MGQVLPVGTARLLACLLLGSLARSFILFVWQLPARTCTLFPYTTLFRSRPRTPWGRSEAGTAPWSRGRDRKSTRLNSSHQIISYAVFCLKKKRTTRPHAGLLLGSMESSWNPEA